MALSSEAIVCHGVRKDIFVWVERCKNVVGQICATVMTESLFEGLYRASSKEGFCEHRIIAEYSFSTKKQRL